MTTKWTGMYSEKKQTKGQKFGNPKLQMSDGERDVREWINEANVDCEIYETIEKYGMIKTHERQAIPEEIQEALKIGVDDRQTAIEKSSKLQNEAIEGEKKIKKEIEKREKEKAEKEKKELEEKIKNLEEKNK